MGNKKEFALGNSKKTVADLMDGDMYKSKMQTPPGQIEFLRSRVETLEGLIAYLYERLEKDNGPNAYEDELTAIEIKTEKIVEDKGPLNKDNIPINTLLIGTTLGRPYILTVNSFNYSIGNVVYDSLSAAAEGVTGNRRSGWTFWRTSDGRTAKEAFGKTGGN